MTLNNKLLKNASVYVFMAFIQKSVSFLLIPLYTALLSPSEFGIVNQVLALGSIYILILTYALDEAAARFYFQHRFDEEKKREVLGSIIILSTILVILGGAIVLAFYRYSFREFIPQVSINFIILSVLILITSPIYTIYQKILRIREDARIYSLIMLGYSITQVALSILFLVFFKLNSLGYILAIALTSAIFGIFSFIKLRQEIDVRFSKSIALEAIKYSSSVVPHTISSWGLLGYTIVVIGKVINTAAVGIFNAVNFIAVIINVFSKAVLDAYQPWVYIKLESGKSGISDLIMVARMLGYGFVFVGFCISLFANEIIYFFINNQYHSGIYITPVLVFSSIVLVLGSLMVFVLYYKKESTKYIGFSSIIGVIINIVLSIFLIPIFGILGAAISLAIANLAISVLKQFFASRALLVNALFIDVYLIAIINLFVSSYVIWSQINFLIKLLLILCEVIIILLINLKQILAIKKLFFNEVKS